MSTARANKPAEIKFPALQRFDQILKKATEKTASDIHLKVGLPPIVRVNGHLYYLKDDPKATPARLTEPELQNMAERLMNDYQRKRFENGAEVDLGYELQGYGRFRINICQQRSQPRIVCRHIPEKIKTFSELMLPNSIESLVLQQRGLILVTGATGSGKSTTLAAMIDHITRNRSCHIVTIEDPIEFLFKDRKSIVTQREVGPDTENFTHALKYALRQDPDVILVGEMRDEETILMALTAAETGHLVLSTLHTVDASETINRILGSISGGSGVQDQIRRQLATVLKGVISQRLIKRKDGSGRIPAVEILINNRRVEEIIDDPERTKNLRDVIEESTAHGMQTFDQSLMYFVKENIITKEQALEYCTNPRDFELRLNGVMPSEWQAAEGSGSFEPSNAKSSLLSEHPQHTGPIEIDLSMEFSESVSKSKNQPSLKPVDQSKKASDEE